MLTQLTKTAIRISNGKKRNKVTLIKTGFDSPNDLSISFSGPKGGNQVALMVDAAEVLEALKMLGFVND